jgi:hypothetical protein
MSPLPVDLSQMEKPFQKVRNSWGVIKPYYTNYLTSINFGNILMAFVAIVQQVIDHGFKFPRVHPAIEVEELKPSFESLTECISVEELAAARITQIEEAEAWDRLMQEVGA